MILSEYRYEKPEAKERLFHLLAGEGAKVLAGGTDLVLVLREEKLDPEMVVDIKGVPELWGIRKDGDGIFIGAAEPIQSVVEHPLTQPYTALVEGAGHIGCYEIRWRATIGGNICNGSPSADSVPGLLLYDATVLLMSASGTRELPLEDFLLGPGKVDLQPGEVLQGVRLPPVKAGSRSCYFRRSRVKGMDLSGLSAGIYCEGLSNFKIALGAAWPKVARAHEAEKVLNSAAYSPALLDEAVATILADISPRRSSMRASPEYKKAMIPELIRMGIEKLNGGQANG